MESKKRFIEIDIIKGFAVILMIFFHIFYLSKYLGLKDYNTQTGLLLLCANISHTLFILMSGVNLSVSYQKSEKEDSDFNCFFGKQMKRVLVLMSCGLILSYLSYLVFNNLYVKFGILHFLSTALLISQLFVNNNLLLTIASLFVLIMTVLIENNKESLHNLCQNTTFLCFITGLSNTHYSSLDHFPLIPYIIYIFIGMILGNVFYKNYKRTFDLEIFNNLSENKFIRHFAYIGKNSFLIYMLHWPILYFIIQFLKKS